MSAKTSVIKLRTSMNFIVYDLEATCWDGRPPGMIQEVIEIGAYKIDDYGQAVDRFSRFVKPQAHPVLSLFCKQMTHISQVDINKAASFPKVIDDFLDWINIDEDYVLCSWGDFDWKIFIHNCKIHHIDSEWVEPHINLKKQYKRIRKLSKPFGLQKTLRKEGFEFDGSPHRGIDDAFNTAKIFIRLIDQWEY